MRRWYRVLLRVPRELTHSGPQWADSLVESQRKLSCCLSGMGLSAAEGHWRESCLSALGAAT